MKIILKEEVTSLGKAGDVVDVARGFGRNFLIPKGMAIEATARNIKMLDHQRRMIDDRLNKLKKEAQRLAQRIENTSVTIAQKAGEEDKLFGSVTALDIEKSLQQEGFAIDRRKIDIDEPIKSLGVFTVGVKLHPEVVAKLKVWVVKG